MANDIGAVPQTAGEVRAEANRKFGAQMRWGLWVAAAILLVPWVVDKAIPASLWYSLEAVHVDDALVGEPVPVQVRRSISRPFLGQYVVTVRPVGRPEPVCNGGSVVVYKPSQTPEVSRDLAYWSAGAKPDCMDALEPGRYIMTTTIIIQTGIPFLPRRVVSLDSNAFRILPREVR